MRRERYIPTGYKAIKETPFGVVYGTDTHAIAYARKRSKRSWYYRFRSIEDRDKKISEFFELLQEHENWKEESKQRRKDEKERAKTEVKIGTIFYNSWGYDQTNIDFYQVVAIRGGTMTLRSICGERSDEGFMCAQTKAVKDAFVEGSEPFTRRLSLSPPFPCGSASMDDGSNHYESWYA